MIVLAILVCALLPVIGSQPVLQVESAPATTSSSGNGGPVQSGPDAWHPVTVGGQAAAPTTLDGTATWCAPTPNYCQSWGRPAMLGAMRSFRYGDTPYQVEVRHDGKSVVVTVVSYCACPKTLIDLSVAAFEQLAPLSRGRIPVTVSTLGPSVTVPPTDVQP